MCSIIGYKGKYNQDLLSKVFQYSRIRGLHSFGYSYYNPELITKKFLHYDKFVKSIHKDKPDLFIAHFRYSTSGDYKDLNNNQPITLDNISIAFNGVISQKNKVEMEEQYNIQLPYENDGYVLINKFNDEDFINQPITFAMVGLENNRLFGLRNDKRPLWYKVDDFVLVVSTEDILLRSGVKGGEQLLPLTKTIW